MENSVLILGAAALQVPIIKYVKIKGYNVIVVSIPGHYPGFDLADKCVYCDIRDVEGILASVEDDDIKAVLTDETDMAVPTVAELAKRLGVAGNDPAVARAYSNKFQMRQECQKAGVSVPRFFHASTIEEVRLQGSNISYPAIMKPEDNQGSRGIYVVNSIDELLPHFEEAVNFSKTGNLIIEEFFKGKEYVVEGFVCNGEYLNFGIGQRKYFDIKGIVIPSQTIFPSNLQQDSIEMLMDAERKLHSHLKPSFGMIHSEYLVNEETHEYILVETALRGGGVYISSHLVPLYSGINNYDMLFGCALGNSVSLPEMEKTRHNAASAYICFTLPEGEIVSVEGVDAVRNLDSVKVCDMEDLKNGAYVKKMTNKTQRLGPIIVAASDRTAIEDEIYKIQNLLKIEVRATDGSLHNIIWE